MITAIQDKLPTHQMPVRCAILEWESAKGRREIVLPLDSVRECEVAAATLDAFLLAEGPGASHAGRISLQENHEFVAEAFFSEGQWDQAAQMYQRAIAALIELQDTFDPDAVIALRRRILRDRTFAGCAGMELLAEPASVGRADLATALERCLTWLSEDERLHFDFLSTEERRHGAEAGARRAALHARLLRQQTCRAASERSPRLVYDGESPASFRLVPADDVPATTKFSLDADPAADSPVHQVLEHSVLLKEKTEAPEPCPRRYTRDGDPWSVIMEWSTGGGEPCHIEVVSERYFEDRKRCFDNIKTILGRRPLPDAYVKLYRWQDARPILEQDWYGANAYDGMLQDADAVLHEMQTGSLDSASFEALRQRVLLLTPSLVSWSDPVSLLSPSCNTGWLLASALANCFTWLAQFEEEGDAWSMLRHAADARIVAQQALECAEQSERIPDSSLGDLQTVRPETNSGRSASEARC